jgi:hypothetical protein
MRDISSRLMSEHAAGSRGAGAAVWTGGGGAEAPLSAVARHADIANVRAAVPANAMAQTIVERI